MSPPIAAAADPSGARASIRAEALRLGFDAVGFARAELGPEARERLAAFLAAGMHGEMGWMEARAEQRSHPRALWPEAVSVIALGLSYAPAEDPLASLSRPDRATISVYARNRDYHDVVKKRLKALGQWMAQRYRHQPLKVFVDTAPVMEKPLAQAAGLGWQGKHTNLVSRAHGSWLFLGEIYTTLDLAPDGTPDGAEGDHCGSCTRCLAACPTDAFPAPYRLDARRCISYLTIEHRGPIPEELRARMGNRIYGCDDCLAVCPWNKFAAAHDEPGFAPLFAGSPVKRIGRDRFIRNVLVAIGNSGEAALRPVALRLAADPDPVVAECARWAAARLEGASA
jgi:epoxyqueuosine reductase